MSRIDRLVAEHCVTFRIIWHRAVNIIWHTTFWCLATPQPMLLIQAATGVGVNWRNPARRQASAAPRPTPSSFSIS